MTRGKGETCESLQVRFEGNIAVMTMNNPRRMNALSGEMRVAMHACLLELEANPDCRAIILNGAKQGREILGTHRPTEIEALAFATVLALEECELFWCLDPLSDNPLLESFAHADYCANDRVVR